MFTALRRIGIVVIIVIAFVLGLAGTVYLSLRSPEVQVPEVVGQHYLSGQSILEGTGLNIRKRARRYKPDAKPDTILDQSPHAGEVVKKGQTVAVVVANEESGDKMPEKTEDAPVEEAKPTPNASPEKRNTDDNANTARNENRDRSNKNTNRNANKNTNKNANNQNANNRNTNNANGNRNANRNTNSDSRNRNNANTLTINRNANANRGNANNRNANTPRGNTNANRPTNTNTNRRTP
jgi:hypothetical protein